MRKPTQDRQTWRLVKFIGIVIGLEVLLSLPGLSWPGYLDSPIGLLLMAPYLSAYLFHAIGVPGLLQHHGACGWAWCAPTLLGWLVIGATWFATVVLMAWVSLHLFAPREAPDEHP